MCATCTPPPKASLRPRPVHDAIFQTRVAQAAQRITAALFVHWRHVGARNAPDADSLSAKVAWRVCARPRRGHHAHPLHEDAARRLEARRAARAQHAGVTSAFFSGESCGRLAGAVSGEAHTYYRRGTEWCRSAGSSRACARRGEASQRVGLGLHARAHVGELCGMLARALGHRGPCGGLSVFLLPSRKTPLQCVASGSASDCRNRNSASDWPRKAPRWRGIQSRYARHAGAAGRGSVPWRSVQFACHSSVPCSQQSVHFASKAAGHAGGSGAGGRMPWLVRGPAAGTAPTRWCPAPTASNNNANSMRLRESTSARPIGADAVADVHGMPTGRLSGSRARRVTGKVAARTASFGPKCILIFLCR